MNDRPTSFHFLERTLAQRPSYLGLDSLYASLLNVLEEKKESLFVMV